MINADAKKELTWLHQQAHHDMHIISSFSGVIVAAHYGGSNTGINKEEERMIAVIMSAKNPCEKIRIIEQALWQLPPKSRRLLDATYGNYLYPPEITARFGELTGAALFNNIITDLSSLLKLCQNHSQKSKEQIAKIRAQAKILLDTAHNNYSIIRARQK